MGREAGDKLEAGRDSNKKDQRQQGENEREEEGYNETAKCYASHQRGHRRGEKKRDLSKQEKRPSQAGGVRNLQEDFQ